METKTLIFLMISIGVVSAGTLWVARAAWRKDVCVFTLALGTVHAGFVDINLLSREWYRGTTRGIEWNWLDYLWLIVLIDEWRKRGRGARGLVPVSMGAMLLFTHGVTAEKLRPLMFGTNKPR